MGCAGVCTEATGAFGGGAGEVAIGENDASGGVGAIGDDDATGGEGAIGEDDETVDSEAVAVAAASHDGRRSRPAASQGGCEGGLRGAMWKTFPGASASRDRRASRPFCGLTRRRRGWTALMAVRPEDVSDRSRWAAAMMRS